MLALARKINESIIINDNIEVIVLEIKGDQVKLGISAPKSVPIYRKEIYMAIQEENIAAAKFNTESIPSLDSVFKKE
ncbi:MAG: carbon storage regulator CsrA [Spirochaetes bacterium]|nr:carbon storage regulator CsrA [Spirochaetota bacterium]